MHEWELDVNTGYDKGKGTVSYKKKFPYTRYKCAICGFNRMDYVDRSWFFDSDKVSGKNYDREYSSCAQKIMEDVLK